MIKTNLFAVMNVVRIRRGLPGSSSQLIFGYGVNPDVAMYLSPPVLYHKLYIYMDLVDAQFKLDKKIGQVSISELHIQSRGVEVYPEEKKHWLIRAARFLYILSVVFLLTLGIIKYGR